MCILDKVFFLEIRIYSRSEGNCPINLHCNIYKSIEDSLEVVCTDLQLTQDDYKLLFGFSCHKCECKLKQHLMVIQPSQKNTACCSKTGERLVLEEEDYTAWFYEV